jgi:predicted transcriptional regulator
MNVKKRYAAKDVMEQSFAIVDGLITVADALELIQTRSVCTLIIEKRNEHDEFGIVLLSDIAKKVIAKDKSPERVNLYEIMTKPLISVHSEMDIRYCARLFESFGLNKAPVIDGDKVLGMVSYENIVLKGLLA